LHLIDTIRRAGARGDSQGNPKDAAHPGGRPATDSVGK